MFKYLLTELHSYFKSRNDKNVKMEELKLFAKKFDKENQIEIERWNKEKNKLELEIKMLKDKDLFFTFEDNAFRISDIVLISENSSLVAWKDSNTGKVYTSAQEVSNNGEEKKYLVSLKLNKKIKITKKEFDEIKRRRQF